MSQQMQMPPAQEDAQQGPSKRRKKKPFKALLPSRGFEFPSGPLLNEAESTAFKAALRAKYPNITKDDVDEVLTKILSRAVSLAKTRRPRGKENFFATAATHVDWAKTLDPVLVARVLDAYVVARGKAIKFSEYRNNLLDPSGETKLALAIDEPKGFKVREPDEIFLEMDPKMREDMMHRIREGLPAAWHEKDDKEGSQKEKPGDDVEMDGMSKQVETEEIKERLESMSLETKD